MIKRWIIVAKDYIKANFHKYFWYFIAFIAGILVAGFCTFLDK